MGGAVGPGKLTAGDDVLILEDEKARMVLRGTESLIGRITTGAARPPRARFARTSLLNAWTMCSHRIPRGTDALIGCVTTAVVAVCLWGIVIILHHICSAPLFDGHSRLLKRGTTNP